MYAINNIFNKQNMRKESKLNTKMLYINKYCIIKYYIYTNIIFILKSIYKI